MNTDKLTSSSGGHPVNRLVIAGSEADWPTRVVNWRWSFFDWLMSFDPGGFAGRTYPESCHPMADGILASSSGRWRNSGMGFAGEYWTLNTLEWPSDAVVSSLSRIVETGNHLRPYFLSARACSGILRRAEKHGRQLPDALRKALESQANASGN